MGMDSNRSLSKYLEEIGKYEPLKPADEVALAKRAVSPGRQRDRVRAQHLASSLEQGGEHGEPLGGELDRHCSHVYFVRAGVERQIRRALQHSSDVKFCQLRSRPGALLCR